MATTFEAFTIKLKTYGCTNPDSINYNAAAEIDNNLCIDSSFTKCIENAILQVSLKDCDIESNKKYLEIYTYYQSLEAALKEHNNYKINMYKDKLAELCNAEYCETC